ncbi:MAG: NFACT family protein, partial [Candidatus Cloacimonetes bacterium]|nr:NFACT family protein [Candidatus Cloacimonadota bacterium]
MHYKYLKQWVIENTVKDLSFHNISRFEDQYLIAFRGHKKALQISFSSAEQFIFLNEDHQIIDFIPFDNSSLIMTHLKHSKIENISIDDDDRIIYIYFTKYNIYNVLETIVIVLELISKYTNLILCRVKDDKFIIIDSLKKISFAENQTRQILPNIEYKKPTTSFQLENTNFEYPLYIKNMKVSCETHKQAYFDMNALFFDLYFEHLIKHKIETFKKQKIKQISKIIKRNENKLEKLANELFSEDYAYELKKKAELLITFQNQIPQNASKVALNDYYHEDYPLIEIELDKKLNLKQNIENYFKKFKKALSGRQIVEEQIKKTKKEISLLKEEIADIEEIDTLAQINSNYEQDITKNREKALFRKLEINDDWEI